MKFKKTEHPCYMSQSNCQPYSYIIYSLNNSSYCLFSVSQFRGAVLGENKTKENKTEKSVNGETGPISGSNAIN